jgi:hypothetical protein
VVDPVDWSIEVGFLCNRKENGEVHQTLHLDVPKAKNFEPKEILPYIVHVPLCSEGMSLQLGWVQMVKTIPQTFVTTVLVRQPFSDQIAGTVDVTVLRETYACNFIFHTKNFRGIRLTNFFTKHRLFQTPPNGRRRGTS